MKSTRLVVLASVLASIGCTDSPTYPTVPYTDSAARLEGILGTVAVNGSYGERSVSLRLSSGEIVQLRGSEAMRLASVDGAEVLVRGFWIPGDEPQTDDAISWEGDPQGFEVVEFVVLAVDGQTAFDGVLIEVDGALALQLADGGLRTIDDPPADLMTHLGERVWVTGLDEDRYFRFGVIP
jgi:hypothetical protein